MTTRLAILCVSFISITTLHALRHPTGFTTVDECITTGAAVVFPFPESDEEATKQFVIALDHGTVVGSGAIVTQEGKLLRDTETYKKDQHKLLVKGRDITQEEERYFDGALVVISSPGQQCYYHWLLQVLPRLKVLTASNLPYDKIYLDSRNVTYRWQYESLYDVMDHLGIARDRLLLIDDETIITAKTLLVPSILWNPSKTNFWASDLMWFKQFFNDVFVKDPSAIASKRIFISRSKAQYRRIANEEALTEFLSEQGFVTLHLEELSLYDQATFFNNAEIIIGPHGAGFTNLIFCKADTHIVEIDHGVQGEEQRSSYNGMTKRMQCRYHPFYVDLLEETESPEDITAPINQDITVDIDAFKQFYHSIFN